MTLTLPMTIDGEEVELRVDYSFFPATRGQRDIDGTPLEPDEGAHCEVHEVWTLNPHLFKIWPDLTEKQMREIEEACLEREVE